MIFSADGLSKSYNGRPVLQNVTFSLASEERLILMGPSGCGKTTLCRILAGLEQPDGGTLHGFEALRLSMVFQENRLCEQLSALENTALPLAKKESAILASEALELLGLTREEQRKPVFQLSGGQRRRTALARAMLAPGDLVILDEPFEGLDKKTCLQAATFVLRKQGKRALLCVTHEAAEAKALGGKPLLLPLHAHFF